MDALIGYKCCTNSRTLVSEYLSTKGCCGIGFTQLDKIKNLHAEVQARSVGSRGRRYPKDG